MPAAPVRLTKLIPMLDKMLEEANARGEQWVLIEVRRSVDGDGAWHADFWYERCPDAL